MRMAVECARHEEEAVCLENRGVRRDREAAANVLDRPVPDRDVERPVEGAEPVEHRDIPDDEIRHRDDSTVSG